MLARARVLAGVLVRRVVAAARRTALLAGPQVHPARADLHALLALPALRGLHRLDRLDVTARRLRHGCTSVAQCPRGLIKVVNRPPCLLPSNGPPPPPGPAPPPH